MTALFNIFVRQNEGLSHAHTPRDPATSVALERKKDNNEACSEIETAHPVYLGSQDTFYVCNIKGVGRIYQQIYVDTYSKVAHCKRHTTKTPITATDLLNDKVLPFDVANDCVS